MNKHKVLIINGSVNGELGQSGAISKKILESFKNVDFKELTLNLNHNSKDWDELVSWADGFIFLTGTYWDSWGSPLQSFLEKTTDWEVSSRWLGKPASVIVTMHSVGGKSVLSRLQGVLNTFGLIIPPLSGLVYSLNTHLIDTDSDHKSDFWSLTEINTLIKNLELQMSSSSKAWATWEVDTGDVKRSWLSSDEIKL
ncbi:MAG: hypothetical protein COW01_13805 [Bdellovibrionales bacterium CG12_big_fil_rev_8_21_14_0_65_38_15]|nr:MAG: hypothetical protein COW79_16625 [Bdellovibrionales bacterium CG22_combo_CG10-13_8_21_14_all_38_13]PIQ53347.1 MAG: hypothetical protein COW01_13805 [Bdellovibrionales bacterium CG12_big_fil_rev_8_21_14_0_65_38_15]PIR30289.1 MAG: hypothetical protein COV38_05950 [Bdellovibrionales bacterium CG11_big_fil_rev_8_21_14_0_20_38_13]